MTEDRNKALIEALLFASSRPLGIGTIQEVTGFDKEQVRSILNSLSQDYESQGRGMMLKEVASGFQLRTLPEFSGEIGKMHQARPRRRLSRSALETLAIIAYRQPVTRTEIEQIRGVDSGAVMKTLMSQDMIRLLGRKEAPGRPMLYGTTRVFLEYFELRDLESLPTLEEIGELGEELDGEGIGEWAEEGSPRRAQDYFGGLGDEVLEEEPDGESGRMGGLIGNGETVNRGFGDEGEGELAEIDEENRRNGDAEETDISGPNQKRKVLSEEILAKFAEKIKS
jgi:segregation and condensation protein B